MTRIRTLSADLIRRLQDADPDIKLEAIRLLLPPGYVLSSPERENLILVLAAIVEKGVKNGDRIRE